MMRHSHKKLIKYIVISVQLFAVLILPIIQLTSFKDATTSRFMPVYSIFADNGKRRTDDTYSKKKKLTRRWR